MLPLLSFLLYSHFSASSSIHHETVRPYLWQKAKEADQLFLLTVSNLIPPDLTSCTVIIWEPPEPSFVREYDAIYPQLARQLGSAIVYRNDTISDNWVIKPKFHEVCSIILYINPQDYEHLSASPNNWLSHLPGSYHRSYHIILARNKPTPLDKLPPALQRMIHRIYVSIFPYRGGYRCELWKCNIFGAMCEAVEINDARYSLTTDVVNFGKLPLIYGTLNTPRISQKAVDEFVRSREKIDLYITFYAEMAVFFNATPIIRKSDSADDYGTIDEHGRWHGAAAEVVYGRAHMSQGLITKDRYDALFLSTTIDSDGLTFATGIPTPIPDSDSPLFIFSSLHWGVWVALIVTEVIYIILLKIIIRKYYKGRKQVSVMRLMIQIVAPILEQASEGKNYKNYMLPETRWIFSTWLLSTVVLGTMFRTNLISSLTYPTLDIPPSDVKGLVRSGYKITLLGKSLTAGTVFRELKMQSVLVKSLDRQLVDSCDVHDELRCVAKLLRRHYACLGIGNRLQQVFLPYLTDENGERQFRISREYLYTTFYTVSISKMLPHLKAGADKIMYHYSESGCYQYYRRLIVGEGERIGRKIGKLKRKGKHPLHLATKKDEDNQNHHSMEIHTTIKSIVLLSFGFGTAILVFLHEFYKNREHQSIIIHKMKQFRAWFISNVSLVFMKLCDFMFT